MMPLNVPVSGSASYIGAAIADVITSTNQRFKAGGSFAMTFTFDPSLAVVNNWQVNFGGGTGGSFTDAYQAKQ